MNIQRCIEVLELRPGAGLEEVKQAYKDLASVWHPDRFSGNARLRQKAEEKMKELNQAYEMLLYDLEARERDLQGFDQGAREPQDSPRALRRSGTEAAFELGTEFFLRACHYVYTSARRIVADDGRGGDKRGKT